MKPERLNIAGRLADYFITSKLTVTFILVCAVMGIVAVLFTPREENPQIIVPGAMVQVILPGASSKEVEELVIRPLEGIVQQIAGVDHTSAVANNSVGVLIVEFKVGEDKEKSLVKLYDRVLGQRDKLPPDAGLPIIKSIDVDDVPILTFTLASEAYNDYALKRLADRMIDGLRSMPDVSDIYVKGGEDRAIRIEIEPEKLDSYGTTLDHIKGMIMAGNVSAPLGSVVLHGENQHVFLDGFISSKDDLEHLIVGSHLNRPIYLRDIATVIDGPPENREKLSRFAFGAGDKRINKYSQPEVPAVTLAVAKKAGTNAVFVADDVIKRVNRMKEEFIPGDVDVIVTRNDGQKADAAVNLLIEHLGIAIAAVFLITLIFLGFRAAVIVGLTVPLILALTLGGDMLFGPTINRITLYALILSLGMLVDAAIVVIENIHRRYQHIGSGEPLETAVLATNEIGNPTNLATVAVMVVFLSMSALTGMPEQYFFPIMFNVPLSMATSLLVAYIVVPWAVHKWIKPHPHDEKHHRKTGFTMQTVFKKGLIVILDRPKSFKWVFMLVAFLMSVSVFLPLWQFVRPAGVGGPQNWFGVEMAMLPKDNKNTFNITIDMSETTPVEITDKLTREIGSFLRGVPEIINYQTWVGSSGVIDFNGLLKGPALKTGSNVAEIRVNLVDKKIRKKSSIELVREIRPEIQSIARSYPGTTIQLVEDPPGPPVRSTLLAEVYGQDAELLRKLSSKIRYEFENTYDVAEVTDTEPDDIYQYRLVPDREKAMLSGLTTAEIAMAVRRLIDGEKIGMAHIEGEKNPIPIEINIPRKYQINPELLSGVLLTNRAGKKIPLSELVRSEAASADRPIYHRDNERVTYIGGEMGSKAPVYAVLSLNDKLKKISLPDGSKLRTGNLGLIEEMPNNTEGYKVLWSGEMRMTLDIYRELFMALSLSLMIIYFMLVAYYKSFSLPLIAMFSIPLGVVGIFPGHLIMQQQFTAASIIGLLALASVVVRNSLLIIDFTLQHIKNGMNVRDAVVESVEMRTRPIILTALAVILGVSIMLSDPVFGGLAISLIYGTAVSTVMTLIVIPLLLYIRLLRGHELSGAGR